MRFWKVENRRRKANKEMLIKMSALHWAHKLTTVKCQQTIFMRRCCESVSGCCKQPPCCQRCKANGPAWALCWPLASRNFGSMSAATLWWLADLACVRLVVCGQLAECKQPLCGGLQILHESGKLCVTSLLNVSSHFVVACRSCMSQASCV